MMNADVEDTTHTHTHTHTHICAFDSLFAHVIITKLLNVFQVHFFFGIDNKIVFTCSTYSPIYMTHRKMLSAFSNTDYRKKLFYKNKMQYWLPHSKRRFLQTLYGSECWRNRRKRMQGNVVAKRNCFHLFDNNNKTLDRRTRNFVWRWIIKTSKPTPFLATCSLLPLCVGMALHNLC